MNVYSQISMMLDAMKDFKERDLSHVKKVLKSFSLLPETRNNLNMEIHRITYEMETLEEVRTRCKYICEDPKLNTKGIGEDKIVNDFIQQIREGNFKDELGHELIKNDAFIKFLDLWLEHE